MKEYKNKPIIIPEIIEVNMKQIHDASFLKKSYPSAKNVFLEHLQTLNSDVL